MIIKRIAVGNKTEGFIESSLIDGCNIISSDDNNKGKTIVLQGLMYALGNIPAFPASFNYEDYYYIVDFQIDKKEYSICRKGSEFVMLDGGKILIFDGVSELKRYWNKNIFEMPNILKNHMQRIVDPDLFIQLFFVGQDKKDTTNIANRGLYNKVDYINMIYNYCGIQLPVMDPEEIELAKRRIGTLKEEKAALLKEHKILKSKKKSATYLSSISDMADFERRIKEMEAIQAKITELKKQRNACANRKSKWETTIKELRSLNRTIQTGELRCMDCDSTNIMYKGKRKDSFSFDVSNSDMRKQIMDSIQDKIESCSEEMEKITSQHRLQQTYLQDLMEEDDISLETIVAYKSQFLDATDAEKRITELQIEIDELQSKIVASENGEESQRQKQEELMKQIRTEMQGFYKKVDPSGNLEMDELFTKAGRVYSGSDATMFYLAKMYALAKCLKHNFPIVIDSFRAEDLSTGKEAIALQLYTTLNNQLIFTTTLKKEEIGKYDKKKDINHIDYSGHTPSQLIEQSYGEKIGEILKVFAL